MSCHIQLTLQQVRKCHCSSFDQSLMDTSWKQHDLSGAFVAMSAVCAGGSKLSCTLQLPQALRRQTISFQFHIRMFNFSILIQLLNNATSVSATAAATRVVIRTQYEHNGEMNPCVDRSHHARVTLMWWKCSCNTFMSACSGSISLHEFLSICSKGAAQSVLCRVFL